MSSAEQTLFQCPAQGGTCINYDYKARLAGITMIMAVLVLSASPVTMVPRPESKFVAIFEVYVWVRF